MAHTFEAQYTPFEHELDYLPLMPLAQPLNRSRSMASVNEADPLVSPGPRSCVSYKRTEMPYLPHEISMKKNGSRYVPSWFHEFARWFRTFVLRSGSARSYPIAPIGENELRHQTPFSGWRGGVLFACIGVGICLLLEVTLLVIALLVGKSNGGVGILYAGSCARTKYLSVVLLIPFNVVGTIMIGSSNYVMQCLNAPTRKDVDNAHNDGHYLAIGTPSLRNLFYVANWKKWVWIILGISTIPVHLLLNSAVFASSQTVDYGALVWSSDWREDSSWDLCAIGDRRDTAKAFSCRVRSDIINGNASYLRFTPEQCISQYSNSLQSTASNVVLVTNETTAFWNSRLPKMHYATSNSSYTLHAENNSTFWNFSSNLGVWNAFDYRTWTMEDKMPVGPYHSEAWNESQRLASQWQPTSWLCNPGYLLLGKECSRAAALSNSSNWKITPEKFAVDHCMSLRTEEHCSLQYSLIIIVVIISCDVVKLVAISVTLHNARRHPQSSSEATLATLGDAIDSFLTKPDPTSVKCCLRSQREARKFYLDHRFQIYLDPSIYIPMAGIWRNQREHWLESLPRTRWLIFAALYGGITGAAIVILKICVSDLSSIGLTNIWAQGIGSINPNSAFTTQYFADTGSVSLVRSVVVINLPQLLFSFLYFSYNGICTYICIAAEWSKFALGPRTLRVSQPKGRQRSTYWLSLPWRYSIPLVLTSALLHWLLSRSLFLVRVDVYGHTGELEAARNISACGFSILAILLVLSALAAMLIALFVVGIRKSPGGIPNVGTCSLAISSMCHNEDAEEDMALQPLVWGVTKRSSTTDREEKDKAGHCCITSCPVEPPVEGFAYA